MIIEGGFTNYGQEIGILMLDTVFPRLQGDIGNALTYDFPVRYEIVKGAQPEKIMDDHPDISLLDPFIDAAKRLEKDGVKAITTSCGFLTPFQKQLAESVKIPVFTSGLLLVPLVRAMTHPDKEIVILTERAHHLNEGHFKGAGWSKKDMKVNVIGMKEDAIFPTVFIGNSPSLDVNLLKSEMTELAETVLTQCPNLGAIVFECTNFGPFTSLVQHITKTPTYGINHLVNLMHHAVKPPSYLI